MRQNNREVQEFISCVLGVLGDPSSLLIYGSTGKGDMTELSDMVETHSWTREKRITYTG